jgi:hypothetical protein
MANCRAIQRAAPARHRSEPGLSQINSRNQQGRRSFDPKVDKVGKFGKVPQGIALMSDARARQFGYEPGLTTWPQSFRDYVRERKYDFGRGGAASWAFIALARGDRNLPEIVSRAELRVYLEDGAVPEELVPAANAVWCSYTALRSRKQGALRRRGYRAG